MTPGSADIPRSQPLPTRISPERIRRAFRAGGLAVAVLICINAVVGDEGLVALIDARRTDAALRRALDDARSRNAELRVRIGKLREQRSAIEAVARQDLGLVKPGETLFIIRNTPVSR